MEEQARALGRSRRRGGRGPFHGARSEHVRDRATRARREDGIGDDFKTRKRSRGARDDDRADDAMGDSRAMTDDDRAIIVRARARAGASGDPGVRGGAKIVGWLVRFTSAKTKPESQGCTQGPNATQVALKFEHRSSKV